MRKTAFITLIAICVCICLSSCNFDIFMTDEKKIERRIDNFVSAYNDGDVDLALESMTKKTRNACEAIFSLAGLFVGVDVSEIFGSVFALGVSTSEGDYMSVEIEEIEIVSEKRAIVKAKISFTDTEAEVGYFTMAMEDDDWFIADITDEKPD